MKLKVSIWWRRCYCLFCSRNTQKYLVHTSTSNPFPCRWSGKFWSRCSWTISRAGDYLLQSWLRVTVPSVELQTTGGNVQALRWTRNLMHNLVRECSITFNDLVAARFDNYHLDFWAGFTVPPGKQNGYNNMIGSIGGLTNAQISLESYTLNLPLPFFYGRDSGVALPTAALPYNDMRLNFHFRDWSDLLIGVNPTVAGQRVNVTSSDLKVVPELKNVQLWSNYAAIVSNDERKLMACAPRDILIEQVQTAPRQPFLTNGNNNPNFDIRFSHAIRFFSSLLAIRPGIQNGRNTLPTRLLLVILELCPSYLLALAIPSKKHLSSTKTPNVSPVWVLITSPLLTHSTMLQLSQKKPVSTATHTHSISYNLTPWVPLTTASSQMFLSYQNHRRLPKTSAGTLQEAGADVAQKYEFLVTAVNNNIIRISGGALGFPVL